jgi:hypothetical protein
MPGEGVAGGEVSARAARREGSRLITQGYAANPLVGPRGGGAMRIMAVIEEPAVIEKILSHLPACAEGRQGALAHPPPPN